MRASILFAFPGLLCGIAGIAHGADEGSPDTVVIAATRVPTPELQIASSVSVITSEDIDARQQRTLPDVLKLVPGLNVVQTGGPGGFTTVFMRGTNASHTKVLVDGIDVSDPSSAGATFDFGQFLTQDIERVEVLRGPQSGLYGSDAIGGVISIITKSGSGPATLAVSAEGGSFDTFNQTAALSGSQGSFHYTTNIGHFHAGATPVTPLDLLAPGEKRNDDYYDNLTGSAKLGFDVTDRLDVGLVARYVDSHLRDTGDDFSTFPTFPSAQQTKTYSAAYYVRGTVHLLSFGGILDHTLGLAYSRDRSSILEPPSPESLDTGERRKIDWQGALRLTGANTLVLGAEDERDAISEPLSASTRIDSGYAELQSRVTGSLYSALNVRYDDNDRFGSKVTYRFAPAYLFDATGTKLHASVGTGFKAPTLSELFQDFPPFFYANPDLRAESSTGYDVGLEQMLRGGAVRAGATYFHNRIRNLIVTDTTGISYANIGKASTDGVESFLSFKPIETLEIRADYTYTEAVDDVLDEELLRRPRHKGSVNAAWRASDALSLNASVLTVGSWVDGNRDFSVPRLRAAGYTTVDVAASFDVSARVTLFGRVDNLLDRHYENPVGFLRPGIGAFAGVKATL